MTKGGPPAWGLGEVLTTPQHKNWNTYYMHVPRTWTDTFVRPYQR
jgi:hypothetical protein